MYEIGMSSGRKGVGFTPVYTQNHTYHADNWKEAQKSAEDQIGPLAEKAPEFAKVLKEAWKKAGHYKWQKTYTEQKQQWHLSVQLMDAEPPLTDGVLMTDEPRFRTEYRVCPRCGEKDLREMISTVSGKWECRNCDYYEEV